ncbi:Unknown protein [Striga hermonthica]|uniref:EF-hand domain-containing protein n=1 Tax=Striga hermonthica TaxID=68872 RepID=A0A9N7RC03_STRHE|nr:Unknown protein [Striga hermonthica]
MATATSNEMSSASRYKISGSACRRRSWGDDWKIDADNVEEFSALYAAVMADGGGNEADDREEDVRESCRRSTGVYIVKIDLGGDGRANFDDFRQMIKYGGFVRSGAGTRGGQIRDRLRPELHPGGCDARMPMIGWPIYAELRMNMVFMVEEQKCLDFYAL